MQRIWDILMYTILAAMVVLVIMNAGSVASLIQTSGNLWVQETKILTGSGYQAKAA